jgi:hypothetical protein
MAHPFEAPRMTRQKRQTRRRLEIDPTKRAALATTGTPTPQEKVHKKSV